MDQFAGKVLEKSADNVYKNVAKHLVPESIREEVDQIYAAGKSIAGKGLKKLSNTAYNWLLRKLTGSEKDDTQTEDCDPYIKQIEELRKQLREAQEKAAVSDRVPELEQEVAKFKSKWEAERA